MKSLSVTVAVAQAIQLCIVGESKAQTDCVEAPAELVSWWRGEGDATDALAQHDGIPSSGVKFVSGKVGQAVCFDGVSGKIELGSWFNLQTFTMAMWLRPAAAQVTYADIIDNNHRYGINWVVQQDGTNLNRYSWGSSDSDLIFFDLAPNVWQQLVIARDSVNTTCVYTNGKLAGSATWTSPIAYDGNQSLRLGAWGGGGRNWNGQMDEIDIYARALTPTEIQALYQADSAGKCLYFLVTNLSDSGPGSLRQALQAANRILGSKVVLTNLTGTIALTSGELLITNSLSIVGPGAASLAVSGNGANRVFTINASGSVAIRDLTIRDGCAANGGAIFCPNANLVLSNCVITANRTFAGANSTMSIAPEAGGDGGGVYCGPATISDCEISGNTSGAGGADAMRWGYMGGNGGRGGGIFCRGTVVLDRCTLRQNTTGNGGFSEWTAGSGGAGGGVYAAQGRLESRDCSFSENTTGKGADGYDHGGNGGDGAGLYASVQCSLAVHLTTFRTNATGDGGSGSAFYNPATGGAGGNGGGIYAGEVATVIGSLFSGNSTGNGGYGHYASSHGGNGGNGAACWCSTNCVINCTMVGNRLGNGGEADSGGTPGNPGAGGGLNCGGGQMLNSILWNNSGAQIFGSAVSARFSDISSGPGQPWFDASTCLNADPVFANLPAGDYRLQATSPCIDAGTNLDWMASATDLDGNPRVIHGTVDMGSYEFNQFPAISLLADVVIAANTSTPNIPFTVWDASTPASALIAGGNSTNQTLVPNANIVFGGSDSNRTVQITPMTDQSGTTAITVTVSNALGIASGRTFLLTVVKAPTITRQPINQTVMVSTNATFSVTAVGVAPLSYQWRKDSAELTDGARITGANSDSLQITTVNVSDSGDYSVAVSNAYGVVTSAVASLTVTCLCPVITACARDQTLPAGANCQFALPDLTGQMTVTGGIGGLTLSQFPPPGTMLGLGTQYVTLTVTDSVGQSNNCTASVVVKDNTPPAIQCPSNMVVAWNAPPGSPGTEVWFTPNVTDNCGPAPTLTCSPPPGSLFPLGSSQVRCLASDRSGNSSECLFTITVQDKTPPLLQFPYVDVDCAGPDGAIVWFSVTAIDNCDTNPIVACSPPSGSRFPIGYTLVWCVATDHSGNSSSNFFPVHVGDYEPPMIQCPSNLIVECKGAFGTPVTFAVSAIDNCDPKPEIVCTPPSGSLFPYGETPVECVATDLSGNSNVCAFTVTVRDTKLPVIQCPDIRVQCEGTNGTRVQYTVSATDDCDLAPVLSFDPTNGSRFPTGGSWVRCTATDSHGNVTNCGFVVEVLDTCGPTIIGPGDQTYYIKCGSGPPEYEVSAQDNCDPAPMLTRIVHSGAFPDPCKSVFHDTYVATDHSGNSTTQSFDLTYIFVGDLQVTWPPNQTNYCHGTNRVQVWYPPPTVTDDCDPSPKVTYDPPNGSFFSVGTTPVTVWVYDACAQRPGDGHSDSHVFSVTVACLPGVTNVIPKYEGLFLAGLSFKNQYTAGVDWNGQSPGNVEFWANGELITNVVTDSTTATAEIVVGKIFGPALREGVNWLTVVAVNAQGDRSPEFRFPVKVIPAPDWLDIVTLMALGSVEEEYNYADPGYSIKLRIPWMHDIPDSVLHEIPLVGKFGAEFAVGGGCEYSISSGEWQVFAGARPYGRFADRLRRQWNAPSRYYLGKREIDFGIYGFAGGIATQTRGIELDKFGVRFTVDFKDEITRFYFSDYVPGLEWARVLDWCEQVGADINTFQRVQVYGLLKFDSTLYVVVQPPPMKYGGVTLDLGAGLEIAYEPDLKVVQGRMYAGGQVGGKVDWPSGQPIKLTEIIAGIYGGLEFKAFGFQLLDERFILLQYKWSPSSQLQLAVDSGRYQKVVLDGRTWVAVPVRSSGLRPLPRPNLEIGAERFVARDANQLPGLSRFRSIGGSGGRLRSTKDAPPPSPAQADLTISTNVFPGSGPAMAAHGQELMLLYVTDNGASNALGFTDINWTRFDGTNWSVPQTIQTNMQAEFAPQVAFDANGDAIAAWERVADPNFTNLDLVAMAAQLEIVWSRWSRSDGSWSTPAALTANNVLDHAPLLCGPMADGSVLLVWTRNESNRLMGTNGASSQVLGRQWNPATQHWSAEQTLLPDLPYRLSQSLAGTGNRAVYAWTRDLDAALTNAAAQQVFYCEWSDGTWSAPTQFTSDARGNRNVRVAVAPDGNRFLSWQQDTNLVLSVNFSPAATLARQDSATAGFADYAMTVGPADNLVLLWQEMSPNGSDAHYAVFDPVSGTWSDDALLTADPPLERSFAPVWDDLGNLTVAYNKVQILRTNHTLTLADGSTITITNVPEPGPVDLVVTKRAMVEDLALESGDFGVSGTNFMPGEIVTLSARVRNAGNLALSNVVVAFWDGSPANGGTLITNVTVPGWFQAGSTHAAVATWVVPGPATNHVLFAIVNPLGLAGESNATNNTQSVAVGGTDLVVCLRRYPTDADGSLNVWALVQNLGASGATNSVLSLRRADASATLSTNPVLATVAAPSLAPAESAELLLTLPAGTQPPGEAFYQLRVDEASVTGDVNTNNNLTTFAVNLWVDSDGDGIPDDWELAYGLNPTNAADAFQDSDGDGMSNLAEYLAGTDPNDPHSYLRIESFSVNGTNGVQLVWGSAASRLYSIERSSALRSPGCGFTNLALHVHSTPPENRFVDFTATNAATFFYRVRVE